MFSLSLSGRYVLINLYLEDLDQLTPELTEKFNACSQCIFCKKLRLNCDCNERNRQTRIQKLPKQTIEDIDLLHYIVEDRSATTSIYLGTYLIPNKQWEQIDNGIRKIKIAARYKRKDVARAFANSFRHEKSKIDGVGQWLKKHYPKQSFALKRVAVPRKEKPSQSAAQEQLRTIYECAFKKGEKAQHGVLKWMGWNWLCEVGGHVSKDGYGRPTQFRNGSCVYEQRLIFLSQNTRLVRVTKADGSTRSEYIRSGILRNDKNWVGFEPGDVLVVADVFGYGISVECGVTKADSLVLPLVHKVCEMTVWIPFHKDVADTDKEGVSEVGAFCIRLAKAAKKGWADIVV